MSAHEELPVYDRIGEDGIAGIVAAFFRQIPGDPILAAMYPEDDLAGAEERLRDFLVQRLGGPQRYSERRGHPRLRMRHAPFPIDRRARDRWMELMGSAIDAAGVPADVAGFCQRFLGEVATFLINRRDEGVS